MPCIAMALSNKSHYLPWWHSKSFFIWASKGVVSFSACFVILYSSPFIMKRTTSLPSSHNLSRIFRSIQRQQHQNFLSTAWRQFMLYVPTRNATKHMCPPFQSHLLSLNIRNSVHIKSSKMAPSAELLSLARNFTATRRFGFPSKPLYPLTSRIM